MSNIIHYRPSPKSNNVRCLNGSAHVQTSSDMNAVTCTECKNYHTNSNFWFNNGKNKL